MSHLTLEIDDDIFNELLIKMGRIFQEDLYSELTGTNLEIVSKMVWISAWKWSADWTNNLGTRLKMLTRHMFLNKTILELLFIFRGIMWKIGHQETFFTSFEIIPFESTYFPQFRGKNHYISYLASREKYSFKKGEGVNDFSRKNKPGFASYLWK